MIDLTFADGFSLVQLVVLAVLAYVLGEPARGLLSSMRARNEHGLLTAAAGRVVAMIEQTMAGAAGSEKLDGAIMELEDLAARYGVELTEAQARVLIEAAVNGQRSWSIDDGVDFEAVGGDAATIHVVG